MKFAPMVNRDPRKPSSGASPSVNKKLNVTAEPAPKPADPLPKPSVQATKSGKMPRRIPAAGESSLAQKQGVMPLPNLSASEVREFIKLYFPPGFQIPEIK